VSSWESNIQMWRWSGELMGDQYSNVEVVR
jgi:hypothetical protein